MVKDHPTRNYFDEYYMPLVEIKYFNVLVDNKLFFDQPVKKKNKKRKLIEMSKVMSDDFITGNSIDFSYHPNYYKLTGIDLSRQTNASYSQEGLQKN